jgi:capsid protein
MFTLFIESENPDALAGELDELEGEEGQALTGGDENLVALGNGIVQYGRRGEKPHAINPSRPNSSFKPFMDSNLQMTGPALGLPYELLMQIYQSSFSASQAANNVARSNFKVQRTGLANDFNRPVYEALMDECVLRGYLDLPGYFTDTFARRAYQRAKWNGPGMPHIDLGKSADNYEKLVNKGWATASEATTELTGGNYYENIQERGREIAAAKEAGLPAAAAEAMTQSGKAIESAGAAQQGGDQGG